MAGFASSVLGLPTTLSTESVKQTFQSRFYFDLAGFALPDQLQGLLAYVDETRLLYGSDYPVTPEIGALGLIQMMDKELVHAYQDTEVRRGIYSEKAVRLLNAGRR